MVAYGKCKCGLTPVGFHVWQIFCKCLSPGLSRPPLVLLPPPGTNPTAYMTYLICLGDLSALLWETRISGTVPKSTGRWQLTELSQMVSFSGS